MSQEILSDALPSHVVSALLRDGQQQQNQQQQQEGANPNHTRHDHCQPVVSPASGDAQSERSALLASSGGRAVGGGLFNMLPHQSVGGASGSRPDGSAASPRQPSLEEAPSSASGMLHGTSFGASSMVAAVPALKGSSGMLRASSEGHGPLYSRAASIDSLHGGNKMPAAPASSHACSHLNLSHSAHNEGTVPAGIVTPSERSFCSNQQVAAHHECVTIFFSDICCFSTWAHRCGCGSW